MSKRNEISKLTDDNILTYSQVHEIPVTNLVDSGNSLYDQFVYDALTVTQRTYTGTLNSLLMKITYDVGVRLIVNNIINAFNVDATESAILSIVSVADDYTIGGTYIASASTITFQTASGGTYDVTGISVGGGGGAFTHTASGTIAPTNAYGNVVTGNYSSVLGGKNNVNTGTTYSTIGGGRGNSIYGNTQESSIVGGLSNTINDSQYAVIGGGYNNTINAEGGGFYFNAIVCGYNNTIGFGFGNFIGTSSGSFIGGNTKYSSIVGGQSNTIIDGTNNCTIGGGKNNDISGGTESVIVGGDRNLLVDTNESFIGGGHQNSSYSDRTFIGGGYRNYITTNTTNFSSIVGGRDNVINGVSKYSIIGGGRLNTLSAIYSSIAGGKSNTVNHTHSHVIGSNITSVSANTTHVERFNIKTVTTGTTAITTLAVDTNGMVVGDYTYTEVSVSSADLLSIGTTPKEILPAPGTNNYYEYHGTIEYTHVTAAYVFSGTGDGLAVVAASSNQGSVITKAILTQTNNVVGFFKHDGDITTTDITNEDYNMVYEVTLNEPINLAGWSGNDPNTGDGTILVKIWYRVKTFGTEL